MQIKNTIWPTVVAVLLCFLSVGYTACNKDDTTSSTDKCSTTVCENGGTCIKGICTCAAGFEDTHCHTAWITRYLGKWQVKERISASSKDSVKGITRDCIWTIRAAPDSPSIFVIDGMMGSDAYNGVRVNMAQDYRRGITSSSNFYINTTDFFVAGRSEQISKGSGQNSTGSAIKGVFYVTYSHEDKPRMDTVNFEGTYAQ